MNPRLFFFLFLCAAVLSGALLPVPALAAGMAAQVTATSEGTGEDGLAAARALLPEGLSGNWTDGCSRQTACRILVSALTQITGQSVQALPPGADTVPFSDCGDESVRTAAALQIVRGAGNGQFKPEGLVTRQEFAVMLARTCYALNLNPTGESRDFSDSGSFADWAAVEIGFLSGILCGKNRAPLLRGTGGSRFSPLEKLTVEQAAVLALRLTRSVTEVFLSPGGALSAGCRAERLPDGTVSLYGPDGASLGSWNSPGCYRLAPLGSVGGADYFLEFCYIPGVFRSSWNGSLISFDGKSASVAASAKTLWNGEYALGTYLASDSALVVRGASSACAVTADGIRFFPLAEGEEPLGISGGAMVTQLVSPLKTTISSLSLSTGAITGSCTVNLDLSAEPYFRPIGGMDAKSGYYFGEIGFYLLKDGALTQISARPTLDWEPYYKDGGKSTLLLSHETGDLYAEGDRIILLNPDGTESVLLAEGPVQALQISKFLRDSSHIAFCALHDQGNQHFDEYDYILDDNGRVRVTDFQPARPESETAYLKDPTGFVASKVQQEQRRLDAAYGW